MITRPSDLAEATVDANTLQVIYDVDDPAATVYNGPCFIAPGGQAQGRPAEAPSVLSTRVLGLPSTAPVPVAGDIVEITSVGPVGDPALVGRQFAVSGVDDTSFLVYRRVHLETRAPSGPVPGVLNG